jgi:predicted ATPase/DNA-binding CsgD family transcriptional regulator
VADPSSPGSFPNNLPTQLTSFIGREEELSELSSLLTESRLLTLTGVGGVGKTRLALQTAGKVLPRFPYGVWFVDLAPLTDASLIPSVTALSIGLSEDPSRPLLDRISDYLRDRAVLLVLDNCEHLIGVCATLAEHLLRACPTLRILATSREALNIPGEAVWPVPPLSLPEPDEGDGAGEALKSEGVRLFAERARAVWQRFALDDMNAAAVARICRRLDGIPLALELAAARVPVLSPEEIAKRLDDRFRLLTAGSRTGEPRHQTLRALVDWSYGLLTDSERILFRRLSVFAGGWTLEAAEVICAGEGIERRDVLTLLAQLVDKSLVVVTSGSGATRYGLLETLRQYAADKLEESGEAPHLRRRHLTRYRELAECMLPSLMEPHQAALFGRLETELGNIRAALEWSKAEPDAVEEGLRLAGALMHFWYFLGHAAEGEGWLAALLALAPESRGGRDGTRSSTAARAAALMALGSLMVLQYRPAEAQVYAEKALVLWRALRDKPGIAFTLLRFGQAVRLEGALERAEALLGESLVVGRQLESRPLMSAALRELGLVAYAKRDPERAQALLEDSLSLAREAGDLRRINLVLAPLAALAIEQGDLPAARAHLHEALAVAERAGLRVDFAAALQMLACVAAMESRPARAFRLAGAAATASRALGGRELHYVAWLARAEPHLELARKSLGERAAAAVCAEGEAMSLKQALPYALGDEGLEASAPAPCSPALSAITAREREVAALIARGYSNPEIATTLVIARGTVKRHVENILTKLALSSRAEIAGWAAGQDQPDQGVSRF